MNKSTMIAMVLFIAGITVSGWAVLANREGSPSNPEDVGEQIAVGKTDKFSVAINIPDGPLMLATGKKDSFGNPIKVRCETCHALRKPNLEIASGKDLKKFHQGQTFNHGDLSCLTCHNPDDYDTLRLADGKALTYRNVMKLCGQCHGPQARDYAHGAHGGMTGYWDLSKGPRKRNNCIDCHDPHSPAYPKVWPVFPPRDRVPPTSGNHGEAGGHQPREDQ